MPAHWTLAQSSSFHIFQRQSEALPKQILFHGEPSVPTPEKSQLLSRKAQATKVPHTLMVKVVPGPLAA